MDNAYPKTNGPDLALLHHRCMQSRASVSQSVKIINLSQQSLQESAVVLEDLRALLEATERF